MQLTLDISIHQRENSPISQAHLEANRELFTQSCYNVLKALVEGEELTTDNAKEKAGTRSLPRRVKDIKDNLGIPVSSEWVLIDGRKSHLKWFMSKEDKVKALEIILNRMKKQAA